MKKLYILFILTFIFFTSNSLFSQEEEHHKTETTEHATHVEHAHHKHAFSFFMSHTHIKSGVKNNTGDNWIALPSFGINYNYNFSEKWAIGLHNDIIIEEFIVEDTDHIEPHTTGDTRNEEVEIPGIERSRPISSAIMISYKAMDHLVLLAGGGMEFSKHENFGVIRFALETPFHIPNNWEIIGAFSYDINIDAYNSITFGLGIAKLF